VSTETFWISKTVVVEWVLRDASGALVDGASVAGTVTLPAGTTAPMNVTGVGGGTGKYRATYDPASAGLHAYRLVATGAADGAEEGTFIVRKSLVGAQPITTDPTTDLGQVRLLISDTDESAPVFTDAEITAFLALAGSSVRLAAAEALDTIASNEVMVSKVIRTQDLQTDGSKVSAELRARATTLREQAASYDNTGAVFAFDVADYRPEANWWPDHELAEGPC